MSHDSRDPNFQLHQSEQRLHDIAEVASDWFWETDSDLRFTYISERFYEVSSIDPKEVIGKTRLEFISEHERKAYPQKWKRHEDDLLNRRPFRNLEYQVQTPDGNPCYIQISGKPFFDQEGIFLGYRGAGSDITSQKVAEKALKDAKIDLENQVNIRTDKLRQEIAEREQAEAAIRVSKDEYQSTLNHLLIGVVVHAVDSSILMSNPEASHILGLTSEQMLGKKAIDPAWSFVHEDTTIMELGDYPVNRVLATKKPLQDYVVGINRPDRNYITWVTVNAIPVFSNDNVLQKVIVNFVEITARKQAEKALRESEEKYRRIFENSVVGFFQSTPEGRFIIVNRAFSKMLHYESPEDLVSSISNIAAQFYVNAQDRDQIMAILQREGRVDNFEFKARCKDGEEIWVSNSTLAIFNKAGSVIRYEGIISNITERKQAEKERLQSEEKYRSFFENSIVGIFQSTPKGRFISVNLAFSRMLGYDSPEELISSITDIATQYYVNPEDRQRFLQLLQESQRVENYEFKVHRKDGSQIWVSNSTRAYFDKEGEAVRYEGIVIDITERRQMANRLQQAYKMEAIGTLAGGIAHDFNNILSAILGYTELSLTDSEPGSLLHGNLRKVMKAGERARDLVHQVLSFSRQGDQEKLPVQLMPIIKEVLKFIRASLPTSIEIQQELRGDPTILADPTQIHQVVMNLCTNAAHAMQDGGGILRVSLENIELDSEFTSRHPGLQPGVHVKLTISDTGYGISPEVVKRIFDPFFTTKGKGEGTGMGLSVVHGIVKSHGGIIDVYSTPGKGSVFTVFFSAIERRLVHDTKPEKALVGGTEHILLVDDEPPLVELGVAMLEALGYQVTGIESSIEALALFKENPNRFDLVITDLAMPKITGDRLAEQLIDIKPDIPIILCTGFSAAIDEDRAKNMGIKAFINKPILRHQISRTIRTVLDKA